VISMAVQSEAGAREAPAGDRPLLEVRHVSKRFGPVQALDDVDFSVKAGEVVAVVGDNGAGKSTLIKTITGAGPADEGDFLFEGRPVTINTPHDSSVLGISPVYQDLALCDNLDVVKNLFLGREVRPGPALSPINEIAMERESRRLLDSLAVRTLKSVRTDVGALSGGQRQTVAIARSMLGEPRLVILDEPTAALGVSQTEQVLQLVKRLREQGLGVILISHNLNDVFAVCDRIVVLYLGRNGGEFPVDPARRNDVVAAITGAATNGDGSAGKDARP
jgi:D-xylose transport system ATP-binding protein